jgi:putative oxidoreductase
MNFFTSPAPILMNQGLAFIRIVVGALMIYHGQEVFDEDIMREYLQWDVFEFPAAQWLVYAGKASEFVSGILLLLGLCTRLGAILLIGTLSFVTFIVGHGKFWYEDQHPFMFVLFGILFLFTGPGSWSVDGWTSGPSRTFRDQGGI